MTAIRHKKTLFPESNMQQQQQSTTVTHVYNFTFNSNAKNKLFDRIQNMRHDFSVVKVKFFDSEMIVMIDRQIEKITFLYDVIKHQSLTQNESKHPTNFEPVFLRKLEV